MALYNIATDITTRQTVWVSTNVTKSRPQLNSHRPGRGGESLAAAGIDGLPAWKLAGLHHNYRGQSWN
jgi:hypothetical protein